MLTAPAQTSEYQNRMSGQLVTILAVTDGTNIWYFSDRPINLADGYVQPLLIKHSGIKEGFDIYSRRFSVASVTVTLGNIRYDKTSSAGGWECLADKLEDIRWNAATLYLGAGERITQLSHCIARFTGQIVQPLQYTDTEIVIRIVDETKIFDKLLPDTTIETKWGYPSSDKVPIVYGEFKKDWNATTDTGLIRCPKIGNNDGGKYAAASHAVHSFSQIYLQTEQLPEVSKATSSTTSTSFGTIELPIEEGGISYIYPEDEYGGDHGGLSDARTENFENAIDQNTGTYANLLDHHDLESGSLGYRLVRAHFGLADYATGGRYDNALGQYWTDESSNNYIHLLIRIANNDYIGSYWDTAPEVRLLYASGSYLSFGTITNLDGTENDMTINFTTDPPDMINDIVWHFRSGDDDNASSDDYPTILYIYAKTMKNEDIPGTAYDGDGINSNETLLKLYEIKLKIRHQIKTWESVWAGVKGRKYDTWIDGRSSNYASGDCIEDPAGIVESLLRDYGDRGDSDIDLSSFIAAENTNVKARLWLHEGNQLTIMKAIRQISEQSTFCFLWSASGKARLVKLNDSSPTTDRTIPYSHIRNGRIKVGKTDKLINYMTVKSRWQEEYGAYRDSEVTKDDTSITIDGLGEKRYSAKWPNICGSSRDHVAELLVNYTNGLWSKEHVTLEFTTKGFTNADLEAGDWIELDDTTVDPHVKCFGASWSGKQFLVTDIKQDMYSTTIKAIKLY